MESQCQGGDQGWEVLLEGRLTSLCCRVRSGPSGWEVSLLDLYRMMDHGGAVEGELCPNGSSDNGFHHCL